jgi:hypothetical protein
MGKHNQLHQSWRVQTGLPSALQTTHAYIENRKDPQYEGKSDKYVLGISMMKPRDIESKSGASWQTFRNTLLDSCETWGTLLPVRNGKIVSILEISSNDTPDFSLRLMPTDYAKTYFNSTEVPDLRQEYFRFLLKSVPVQRICRLDEVSMMTVKRFLDGFNPPEMFLRDIERRIARIQRSDFIELLEDECSEFYSSSAFHAISSAMMASIHGWFTVYNTKGKITWKKDDAKTPIERAKILKSIGSK